MRRNGNAGEIRIIEAVFAVFVVFSAFTVTANLPVPSNTSRINDLTSTGIQTLYELDSSGILSRQIDERNWTALREELNLVLPAGASFNVTVLDEAQRQLNTASITNDDQGGAQIASVEYLCASQGPDFHWYVVRMQLGVNS